MRSKLQENIFEKYCLIYLFHNSGRVRGILIVNLGNLKISSKNEWYNLED